MSIRKRADNERSFSPEDLNAMGEALTMALAKLGLNDESDPLVEMIARRIIRAALDGERDPTRLSEIAAGGREQAPS
jgi:hypothetical protein